VDKAFLFPHMGLTRQDWCAADNDLVSSVAAKAQHQLVPVATAWPQWEEMALAEIQRSIEMLGIRALKFHPWLQGFSTADPYCRRICGFASELGIPIFFHDGTPCYSLSEQIGGLARRFPSTQIVLTHAGLLWNWRSALEAARRPNLWLCLCGPHMRAMEIICQRADPDRILWGSDFGFSLADPIDYRLNLFLRTRIADSLKDKILGTNPLRLMSGRARG
jgi:predicted TIM-barrel fold metal-dependent hydrolase